MKTQIQTKCWFFFFEIALRFWPSYGIIPPPIQSRTNSSEPIYFQLVSSHVRLARSIYARKKQSPILLGQWLLHFENYDLKKCPISNYHVCWYIYHNYCALWVLPCSLENVVDIYFAIIYYPPSLLMLSEFTMITRNFTIIIGVGLFFTIFPGHVSSVDHSTCLHWFFIVWWLEICSYHWRVTLI